VLRTGNVETEVAQQLVNDSRQKEQSLTNEITLVPRRMRGEDGREKEKGNAVMLCYERLHTLVDISAQHAMNLPTVVFLLISQASGHPVDY
jgi:hypothetical protein